MLGADYGAALAAVAAWRTSAASGVNDSSIADADAFLAALADTPVDEVLFEGSPWGAVELARRAAPGGAAGAAPFPRGVRFPAPAASAEAAPWLELVSAAGTFSAATLATSPTSFQVSGAWLQVLRASAAEHGATWLHDLHMGVILAETGAVDEPRALFNASLAKRPSALAARCLAVLQATPAAARALYRRAWALALAELDADTAGERRLTSLATETVAFELQLQGDAAADAELRAFLEALPVGRVPALAALDIVLIARATVALAAGDYTTTERILTAPGAAGCFPTIASERDGLMALWNGAQLARATAANGGVPLTPWEQRLLRARAPVPRNIGCPYGGGEGYPGCTYW